MGLQFEEKREGAQSMHILTYILIKQGYIGDFFFRVHSGKVIISMDILVYGKCRTVRVLIRKTEVHYEGYCTCLKYCFDELYTQLNFHVENPSFIQSMIFEQHPTWWFPEFIITSVHFPG